MTEFEYVTKVDKLREAGEEVSACFEHFFHHEATEYAVEAFSRLRHALEALKE